MIVYEEGLCTREFCLHLQPRLFLSAMSLSSPQSWRHVLLSVCLLTHCLNAFKVTGAQGGVDQQTGARPYRYDISDLQQSGPAFDLFILALSSFQATNQSDPLSYFQVSGMCLNEPYG